MAARRPMAGAPSQARIRPRSTAQPLMPRVISLRMWSPPGSPINAHCRSPTRSAYPSLSRSMWTWGTGSVAEGKLEQALHQVMDLSPRGIREHLKLSRPIYERTAAYGHFGRQPDNDGGFSWERL